MQRERKHQRSVIAMAFAKKIQKKYCMCLKDICQMVCLEAFVFLAMKPYSRTLTDVVFFVQFADDFVSFHIMMVKVYP
jgi:hypothetical protein